MKKININIKCCIFKLVYSWLLNRSIKEEGGGEVGGGMKNEKLIARVGRRNFIKYLKIYYIEAEVFWVANDRQNSSNSSVRPSNTFNKNIKHSIPFANWGQQLAISWLLCANLQNKTLRWLLRMNLQNKTVTPFGWSQKIQHKYVVSNSCWKLSPIINKREGRGCGKRMFWMEKNRKIN